MLLSLWIVLALGVFAVGCGAKALRYLRMPMHVRWELYPVAHEKGRAHYGGSYFEEVDWWTKPREVEKLAEVRPSPPPMWDALHPIGRTRSFPAFASNSPWRFGASSQRTECQVKYFVKKWVMWLKGR